MPGRVSPAAVPAGLKTRARGGLGLCLWLAAAALAGCNSALYHGLATACEPSPDPRPWSYLPTAGPAQGGPGDAEPAARLARFAPVFVIAGGEAPWNRIGTPTITRHANIERVRVDPEQPALYAEQRSEEIGGRTVHQLVYRVHFDQFLPTLGTLTSLHRNAGLLVLVSVDAVSGLPLCVTSVHTCGCWAVACPTAALAPAALPADWPAGGQAAWGEELPARLPLPAEGERFLVHLRSGTHRVHELGVGAAPPGARALPLHALTELRALPVAGAPGVTKSFFHERGYLRGHVKGAWAPLEGLTLGLLTLDPRLGMDRDFGAPEETGARFHTALAPWRREATRLDRFGPWLASQGFDPAAFAPAGEL